MFLIKSTGRGGGRFPERRRPEKFRKRILTDKQKGEIFGLWIGIVKTSAVKARGIIAKNKKVMDFHKELVSEAISPVKLDAYIEKRNSGEIFLIAFAMPGVNFLKPEAADFRKFGVEIVPDGFLTSGERFALQRLLSSGISKRKVFTISEFKQWAMKNIDFAVVADAFNL